MFAVYRSICFGVHTVLGDVWYVGTCSHEGVACDDYGMYGFKCYVRQCALVCIFALVFFMCKWSRMFENVLECLGGFGCMSLSLHMY